MGGTETKTSSKIPVPPGWGVRLKYRQTPAAQAIAVRTHRVNHSVRFMDKGVCTNQAESYFSRLRRMEVGTHHHIAGIVIAE
jgi:hypothetical protein